jgi:hypothetical protein
VEENEKLIFYFEIRRDPVRLLGRSNPMIVSYNARVARLFNTINSLVRLEFLYLQLQGCNYSCHGIGFLAIYIYAKLRKVKKTLNPFECSMQIPTGFRTYEVRPSPTGRGA